MSARPLVCKSHGKWVVMMPCAAGCASAHRPINWPPLDDALPTFDSWRQAVNFATAWRKR